MNGPHTPTLWPYGGDGSIGGSSSQRFGFSARLLLQHSFEMGRAPPQYVSLQRSQWQPSCQSLKSCPPGSQADNSDVGVGLDHAGVCWAIIVGIGAYPSLRWCSRSEVCDTYWKIFPALTGRLSLPGIVCSTMALGQPFLWLLVLFYWYGHRHTIC
jgi:hypothetical protein